MQVSSLSIAIAKRDGTLSIVKMEGRFGEFFAIKDRVGTIEVFDTRSEAEEMVASA